MKPEIQKLLCEIARKAGTEIHFAEGMPIQFYGCQHMDAPIAIISSDQPQSEQIFTILHEIAHAALHYKKNYKLPLPAYFNRPYENEFLSDSAYKTKRIVRQKLNQEWQADLWALCAFCQLGCPNELQDFLKRHPEKVNIIFLVVPCMLKDRLVKKFKKLLRPFISMPKTA